MPCLIKISTFLTRVYGNVENGATPPTRQTIARMCSKGELPAEKIGKLWYIRWDIYQKQTGDDLVNKVLNSL